MDNDSSDAEAKAVAIANQRAYARLLSHFRAEPIPSTSTEVSETECLSIYERI
jgi:hypothetical protein